MLISQIIASFSTVPDAAFPESEDPNCHVMEDEETGKMVVIAKRTIKEGEFFSIAAGEDVEDDVEEEEVVEEEESADGK